MARHPLSHWLYLGALILLWGSAFLLTRLAVSGLPPFTVVAGRLGIAALILVPLVVVLGLKFPTDRRRWGFLLTIAITGNCIPFALLTWAQQHIDSGLAGIYMSIMPLLVLVLAHFFVDGERMTRPKLIGFGIGFCGMVVLFFPALSGMISTDPVVLLSQLAALGTAACYGITSIIIRRAPETSPVVSTAVVMMIAVAIMIPLALGDQIEIAEVPLVSPLAVGVLGIGATALATIILYRAIAVAGPSFVSMINYVIPLYAVFLGALVFGEALPGRAFAALALILVGIAISQGRISLPGMTLQNAPRADRRPDI